ncbi:putative ribonuclease H-like domain-containing protein [Tanacetum coccineum]
MRLLAEAFAQRVFFYPLMYDQREGDELGSNGGSSNSVKKVVQGVAGSASGSPSNTPLVAKISELKSQMIEGKLVLQGDDGKLLKPCNPTPHSYFNVVSKRVNDLVNEDSDSKVEEIAIIAIRYEEFLAKWDNMMEIRRATQFIKIKKAGNGKRRHQKACLTMDEGLSIGENILKFEKTKSALMAMQLSSLSHLVKDCDYYEKKMAREVEFKKQRVFNTGNRVAKPVWTNANRVNHANKFAPRPVQLNAGRPNIKSVRTNVNTDRTNINTLLRDHPLKNMVDRGKGYTAGRRFQMSSMGELTFFLGLQVKQNKAVIFTSQDKYVAEILKKFDLVNVKTAITPMETKMALTKDEEAIDVDVHLYRSMIAKPSNLSVQVTTFYCYFRVMAQLKYCDKHNQVGFLRKPDESAWFAEIVDFLRGSNLRANLKSKTKFLMYPRFLQLILDIQTENKHPYLAVTLTKKIFRNMKRGFRGAPRPLLPAMLLVATTNPSAGQEHPDVAQSQPSSSTIPVPSTSSPPVQSPPPTTASIPASTPPPIPETEPEPMEQTFVEPSPAHQHFSPPQEHAQGQMTVDDLLQVVPQLMSRIDSLEKDLKQTKLTMGSAIVKLVKKVKKLEGILKRRNVVLSDSEEEEPEAQGRKSQDDPLVSLVQGLVTPSKTTVNASREEQVEDISPNTLEAAKTLSRVASQKPKSIDKGRRYKRRKETKGKKVVTSLNFQEEVSTGTEGVNTAEGVNTSALLKPKRRERPAMIIGKKLPKNTLKESNLQEEVWLAESYRLKNKYDNKNKRRAQVQFEAQHYTDEDWDLIRAKIEANAELSKSMLGSDLQGEDFAKKMVELVNQRKKHFAEERARVKRNKPMTQSQLRTYMMNYLKNQGTWKLSQLKNLSFEEVKEEFDKLVKQVESFAPINFEATKDSLKRFGEELQTKTSKRLKSDEAKDDEPTKKTGKRRKQMARKGLHTDLDKDDSEDSDEASEQDDSASGTKIPINPVPVAMKSPSIATYKIIKQGEKGVYQIVREDGTDIVYINFGAMLKDITRDDLTELYRIVMNRYGMNGPEDELERKSGETANPFNALNTIKEGDELGSNGGSSNSVKKVVQDVAGSASGSPSNTPLVAKISELKSQMIEGRLVLLGDDGKLLKPCNPTPHSSFNVVSKKVNDLVNEDSDSKVEEENNKEDSYDDGDFDDLGLTDAQIKFANAFDVNLRGQLR